MATYKHNQQTTQNSLPSERSERGGGLGWGPKLHSAQPPAYSRRGVILLVLLGMLALFGATAFAFLVIASHARQTSMSLQKIDRVMYSPRQDLEKAMLQALRDTNVANSVLHSNSLLQDLYGDDSIRGWVINRFTVSPLGSGAGHPKGFTASQAYMLPGTATDPASYVSPVADGQLIEFTAGYTIPAIGTGATPPPPGATGGLDLAGNPIATSFAENTITIPEWFGSRQQNSSTAGDPDNEPLQFRRRVGCVLTIVDPNSILYNKSTRIVGYRPVPVYTGPNLQIVYHRYQVLPFEGVGVRDTFDYFQTTEYDGHDFVINGTPYSGAGAGYNPTSGWNNGVYQNLPVAQPYALLPNTTDSDYHDNLDYLAANEDYDAPDYQNMLLAMEQWDGTSMTLTRSPSLHRPELAAHWVHFLASQIYPHSGNDEQLTWITVLQPYGRDWTPGTGDEPLPAMDTSEPELRAKVMQIKRRCLLRPLREDHANFDGSNAAHWPVYTDDLSSFSASQLEQMAMASWGAVDLVPNQTLPWDGVAGMETPPWDVDNDGDGIPDSIWVDIGLPVRSLPNGRKIKPLVAIHCIDQDGKLNLNTAGSLEQLNDRYTNLSTSNEVLADYFTRDNLVYAQQLTQGTGATTAGIDLPRGQGCGPAEINLYQMLRQNLGTHAAAMRVYRQLLLGGEDIGDFNGDSVVDIVAFEGRYGEMWHRQKVAPQALTVVDRPAPGFSFTTGSPENIAASRMFGFPANYLDDLQNNTALAYGSPMDLKGTMVVGLDLFGQPIYSVLRTSSGQSGWIDTAWQASDTDTPYELMLGSIYPQALGCNANGDNSFSLSELEPILRRYDSDAPLLPDRLRRLLEAGVDSPYRRLTTTESWDLPVPNLAFPTELLDDWRDISREEISTGNFTPPQHVTDLIAARVRSFDLNGPAIIAGLNLHYPSGMLGVPNTDPIALEGARRIDFSQLLALDVLAGMRMDLNRPFGNGYDDDGNGVIDEPAERLVLGANDQFEMFKTSTAALATSTTRFDHDNDGSEYRDYTGDGTIDSADDADALLEHKESAPTHDKIYMVRQAYARHLYVLMLALVDQDWYPVWDEVIARQMDSGGSPTNQQIYEARARAIAQWAINVVDFRDADSVMTPFEYDIYPFAARQANLVHPGRLIKTWDVDGDLATIEPERGLVWGCERPELLITETMATHDRRQLETTGGVAPYQYNNLHRPEGSLFVEFFNPSSPSEPVPGELAIDTSGTNTGGIRLNQKTPTGSPVWRLAVYIPPSPFAMNGEIPNSQLGYADPQSPEPNPFYHPTLNRLVYFVDDSIVLPEEAPLVPAFRTSVPDMAPILPRRYAVVGPGDIRNTQYGPGPGAGITLLGELPAASVTDLRRIEIIPDPDPDVAGQVRVFSDGQNDTVEQMRSAGQIQPPVGIVIDRVRAGSGDTLRDLRLSISEPVVGYAADSTPPPPGFHWVNGYDGGATPQEPAEDLTRSDSWGATPDISNPGFYSPWNSPLGGPGGTISAIRYVHLQRLADPTRPYDADWNPYRTVDFAPVDLTVFDSRSSATGHLIASTMNKTFPVNGGLDSLHTRQRGENTGGAVDTSAFWQPELIYDPASDPLPLAKNPISLATGTPPTIDGPLGHSLGFLNEFYYEGSPLEFDKFAVHSAYTGAPGRVHDDDGDGTDNFDSAQFPWLTWLNRPFANPMELLQVPAVRASRLLLSYENDLTQPPPANHNYISDFDSFPHLGGFFAARQAANDVPRAEGKLRGTTTPGANDFPLVGATPQPGEPHLYRLFEYVQVPTRFVSSYIHGEPDEMMGRKPFTFVDPVTGATLQRTEPDHPYHPPFNAIHTYREPGKVNLNTVVEPEVLAGVMNDHATTNWTNFLNQNWTNFANARRTYNTTVGIPNLFSMEAPPTGYTSTIFTRLPTRVGNPFRSFAGADFVPQNGSANDLRDIVQDGVNATLLRAQIDPTNPTEDLIDRAPLLTNSVTFDYRNSQTSPFFKYQTLERLSNLVTTRSNVYALWITVGYFEAEPVPNFDLATQADIYPEGYSLGQELDVDTGDVTRHRAFYIIDRSIPVGFIPGEDLNTEKAIRLRRFIE